MNPLGWLIGLILPACGFHGASGLPAPQLMDVAHIVRPATPNTALGAPRDFSPKPDIIIPISSLPADQLFAAVWSFISSQPRIYQAAVFPEDLQVHFVARSPLLNFPDLIMVQVQKIGSDQTGLIIYSRSVYGRSDLGVNRKRIESWLAGLRTKIPSYNER